MKKTFLSFLLVSFFSFSLLGQNSNDWIFSYGANKVSIKEFERGILKNQPGTTLKLSESDIEEYLQLYTNFKLKVQSALDQKRDTTSEFLAELLEYKKQMTRPFLTDKEVTEQLMQEAYDRLKYEVNASHILIIVKNFDNAADTLRAYTHLDSIRKQILNGNLTFENAAELFSEDPSAKSNKGELGYFTAFEMVYPFESQAYTTEVGAISQVFKTSFGYHILKLNDKRNSLGEVKVAHLMLALNANHTAEEDAKAKERINGIYQKLISREKTFEELVQLYSEDVSSKKIDGELNWFSRTSQFPPAFKDAAFALKTNGEYSKPVKTPYGYHILKRIDYKPLDSYEKMKQNLSQRVNRDSRSSKNTLAVYNRVSKELNLVENTKNYKKFVKTSVGKDFNSGEWKYKENKNQKNVLFSFANQNITVKDFAEFIEANQSKVENASISAIVDKHYDNFKKYKVMSFYETNLESYNEEYKYLLQEYKEGILLFGLMDEMVWAKSLKDSTGLEKYFSENRAKYQWADRVDAHIYTFSDVEEGKKLNALISKNISNDSIISLYKKGNSLAISVRNGKFAKGDDPIIDDLGDAINKPGIYNKDNGNGVYYLIRVNKLLPAGPKELDEIRGPVSSDYQDVLENSWLEELRKKYPVEINQEAYKALVERFTK